MDNKALVNTGAYTIEEANAQMAINLHPLGAHEQAATYEKEAMEEAIRDENAKRTTDS